MDKDAPLAPRSMHRNLRLFYLLLLLTALVAGANWYTSRNSGNLAEDEAVAFAVDDTASISRIFIADRDGGVADLERIPGERYWLLNGEHWARKDAVDLLLKTFLRARVKAPVPLAQREQVVNMLAARGKKVEVYGDGPDPIKTWYIGTPTADHTGTHMVLETSRGKSKDPYVVHMEGFTGFLSTRFFTDEREWRYTGVFDFPGRALQRVEVESHDPAYPSYAVEVASDGALSVWGDSGKRLALVDTLAWKDQFLRFRKVHLETYNHHLDSAGWLRMDTASAAFTMRAWGRGSLDPVSIELLWKDPIEDLYDENGELMPHDGARMYARFRGEVVLVQRFVFDPLLNPPFAD
jgi:hypothetical protein